MKRLIQFIALVLLMTGCLPRPLPWQGGSSDFGVDVTWHGHSCFSIRDSLGRTLVIDPFDDTVGYGRLDLRADALLITHNHFDHNFRRAVKVRLATLDAAEKPGLTRVASGIDVLGVESEHDDDKGAINGHNLIFVFSMGGLRIAHMGDIGQAALTLEQKKAIGRVDILFIPVGGFVTVDAVQAKGIVDELKPGAVFPMHSGDIRFYRLAPVSHFTALFPKTSVRELADSNVRIRRSDLASSPVVYILKPTTRNY